MLTKDYFVLKKAFVTDVWPQFLLPIELLKKLKDIMNFWIDEKIAWI